MVAWIRMVGRVAGSTLITGTGGDATASFLLADEQSALNAAGRLGTVVLPWCQVVCSGFALVRTVRRLVPGDEVCVHGRVSVQKPGLLTDSSDAVLVSIFAESLGRPEANRP